MNDKILVAMSGGVDSSVAAALLKEQGFDVAGATLRLFTNEDIAPECRGKTCCSLGDVEDAKSVAYRLGIPHYVFNFGSQFKAEVMDRFAQGYLQGLTPNPCIDCNKYIKFRDFLGRARMLGYDRIATGHYARREYDEASGRWILRVGVDKSKDQTYVLCGMTQEQLERTLFPLGELTKPEVRAIAERLNLINASKPDSQDICFVPDGDYGAFIARHTGDQPRPGPFLDTQGRVIGTHKGLIYYTIGQRRGLGSGFGKRMYVVKKDVANNTVTLGEDEALFSTRLIARDVNLIAIDALRAPMRVQAKIRYSHSAKDAVIHPLENGNILVEFLTPQRAAAPGQTVCFYDGDVVVGGGIIAPKTPAE